MLDYPQADRRLVRSLSWAIRGTTCRALRMLPDRRRPAGPAGGSARRRARAADRAARRGQDDQGRAGAARRRLVHRQVLLLVPRRLAARAAAEFMAAELGEKPGETIGYATRLDSKVGKATRVIAMTHGVFLSRIEADPELAGVSAVLFDEVHERSLDNDLALALALDAASALRPDLRLVAMSATLDVDRFQRAARATRRRSSARARAFRSRSATPAATPQRGSSRKWLSAIRAALGEHEGSLLAFLPGVAEIERTADALGPLPADVELHKLHGGIEPGGAAQGARRRRRRASASSCSRPASPRPASRWRTCGSSSTAALRGGRATTAAPGLTRLVTERASRAAVTQRAGRAARQAPGHCDPPVGRSRDRLASGARPAGDPRSRPCRACC